MSMEGQMSIENKNAKEEKRLLVVVDTKNFLVMSIMEKLASKGIEIIEAMPDINQLNYAMDKINGIMICTSEKMISDSGVLVFIRDKAIEDDIPMFLYGDSLENADADLIIGAQGIKFIYTRPIEVNEVIEGIEKAIILSNNIRRKKVLVVDDSGAMLRNVKAWLGDRYQVTLANSGMMAIKFLATDRPDLVLLDYEMPVLDGKQVLEMIRSETEFQDIPVIFLTSKDDRESVLNVMKLKPNGYLLKTLPPEKIISEVDSFFERQKKL